MLELSDREGQIFLARIELAPKWQKMETGSHVITGILDNAKKAGKEIRLQVLRRNPVRGLYERLCFFVFEKTDSRFKMKKMPN